MAKKQKKKKTPRSKLRRLSTKLGVAATLVVALLSVAGDWFVHHPRAWLSEREENWPKIVTSVLYKFGNRTGDITDAFGWTGTDAIYEYDEEAPSGSITFAGIPQRIGSPAPSDIRILQKGEFIIGWSDTLRHAVWCAYHVKPEVRFQDGKRPSFLVDKSVPSAPLPEDYTKSGFDRGHMVPNHAIISRYGEEARRETFRMTNIAPQTAALNRGVWRDFEHRIADLWTSRYGEIWVIVGAVPSTTGRRMMRGVDIPSAFYQIVIAQEGFDVRALAVLIPQDVDWDCWAARHIISIDDLEEITGLDFNPDLPSFIQDPLEAECPSRLWPIRPQDILRQINLSVTLY